jgi:hypothetical protein
MTKEITVGLSIEDAEQLLYSRGHPYHNHDRYDQAMNTLQMAIEEELIKNCPHEFHEFGADGKCTHCGVKLTFH